MQPAAPPVFILSNSPGTIDIRVSGTNQALRAWIDKKKNVWAQMPLLTKLQVKTVGEFQIVELEGIAQVVTPLPRRNNSPDELKQSGFQILRMLKLTESCPASGVMFVSREKGMIKIDPVVWVRDIKTLFYETACASGTTAVGLLEFINKREVSDTSQVIQPSGELLRVTIKKNKQSLFVAIGGKIKILRKNISFVL